MTMERSVRPQETRNLTFRAQRVEDGDVATVSVFRVDGHGEARGTPIAETEVELRSGQAEYVAEITLPEGGGGCCQGGDGPAGLRFGLKVEGTRNRTPSPLARITQQVGLRLEASPEVDWNPNWQGARVIVREREADLTHERFADARGEVRLPELLCGGELELSVALPRKEVIRGEGAAAEDKWVDAGVYAVAGDAVDDVVRVLPGTPVVFRIDGPLAEPLKVRCLPPPVMVNIRPDPEDAPEPAYRLSDQELSYFKAQGNAAVFVHGYNVPQGDLPHRIVDVDGPFKFDERTDTRRRHWSASHDSVARTVAYDQPLLAQAFKGFQHAIDYPQMVVVDPSLDPDDRLNSDGAWGWLLCMEYNLNRAAGLGGGNDDEWPWEYYTRCIGVSWSGDNGRRNFKESQTAAVTAGRRLVPLLCQLRDAGVKVTLIGHSLGARVVLSALHVHAGTDSEEPLVASVVLWQAAVADTALAPAPDNEGDDPDDPSPLGTAVFPRAHRAAERFLVLHSRGDNVLGGDVGRPGNGSLREGWMGFVGGIYPKHRWSTSMRSEFSRLLEPFLGSHFMLPVPMLSSGETRAEYQRKMDEYADREDVRQAWQGFREAVMDELHHAEPPADGLLPEYNHLSPVALNEHLTEADAEAYLEALYNLWRRRFEVIHSPRPALGYSGPADERGGIHEKDLIPAGLIRDLPQGDWLHQHSGMRVPEGLRADERNENTLFEKVYQDWLWDRLLRVNQMFGAWTSNGAGAR